MPAYFAPVPCTGPARNITQFDRIKPGTRWKAAPGLVNGESGTVVWLDGEQPTDGDWKNCGNGLSYLYGQKMPDLSTLAREHNVQGIDYTTSSGKLITIPIASASPRKILFSTGKIDSLSNQFAIDAFNLFDRLASKDDINLDDPSLLKLIADAIAHTYYITPEMLDEMGLITTADIDPIICCLMGSDPKKAAASAGAGSN